MADAAPFLALPPGGLAPADVWWLRAADGVRLRAARWAAPGQAPIAQAVLLSGRTEFLEKMAIPAAALTSRGYDVVSLDWRGQGLSDRLVEPRLKGHVGDFAEFQRDFDALMAEPVVTGWTGPRLLMAHSMGGAIATRAMLRSDVAQRFVALVLSAPMYGIAMSAPMRAAAWLTARIARLLGRADRWPPFGDVATPYVLSGTGNASDNVLTSDAEVWEWLVETARTHSALNTAMPTIGWFDAAGREMKSLGRASKLGLPAICLLGSDEQVIDSGAMRRTCARLAIPLEQIDGARHEHLVEAAPLRSQAWTLIDGFLAANGLPAG